MVKKKQLDSKTELYLAKDLMYDAWEAKSLEQALNLTEKALEIYPDCTDAMLFLIENTPLSDSDRIKRLEDAVEAGKREIEMEAPFDSFKGYFWGCIETRPYMRARYSLVKSLWSFDRKQEAIKHEEDLIKLNPNDNLGVRYTLIPHLLEQNLLAKAEKLLKKYPEDSAFMTYAEALLFFLQEGDTQKAKKSLKAAIKSNPYLPKYLLGKKYSDKNLEYYSQGEESEAIAFMESSADAWLGNPNALKWLKENL